MAGRRRPAYVGAATVAFLSVYDRYPNKLGKMDAAQTWQDMAAVHVGGEEALAAAILARFDAGLLRRHPYDGPVRYVAKLENFLAGRMWEDADQPRDVDRPAPARAVGYHLVRGPKDWTAGMDKIARKS